MFYGKMIIICFPRRIDAIDFQSHIYYHYPKFETCDTPKQTRNIVESQLLYETEHELLSKYEAIKSVIPIEKLSKVSLDNNMPRSIVSKALAKGVYNISTCVTDKKINWNKNKNIMYTKSTTRSRVYSEKSTNSSFLFRNLHMLFVTLVPSDVFY